jgi:phosphoribosyl 1,2-cyclic phosphodiesterase
MTAVPSNGLSVTFWGVRGSFATAGASTTEYGGNSPCVQITIGERLFIIDAGTGIIPLGRALAPHADKTIDILFSHLHLDHTMGLAFFAPAFSSARTIRTWTGNLGGDSAAEPLRRLYSPPLFPVELSAFPARFEHHGFRAGETLSFDGAISIATLPLRHPSGATGYRFEHAGRSVCFVSDIEHETPWPPPALVAFVRDADLLIYDTMYSGEEYARCIGWGHSTVEAGLELCEAANVSEFAAFHHNPAHDDATLGAREAEMRLTRPTAFFAREGMKLVYPARAGLRSRVARRA